MCGLLSLNLSGEWRTYTHVQPGAGAIGHVPDDQRMQWETESNQQETLESGT